jgi:hypothetical protein
VVSLERDDTWASFGDELEDLCDDVRGGTETGAPAPADTMGELVAEDGKGSARGVVMLEFAAPGDGSWSAGVLGEDAALLWRLAFFRDDDGWWG